jgi:hypothetical protein
VIVREGSPLQGFPFLLFEALWWDGEDEFVFPFSFLNYDGHLPASGLFKPLRQILESSDRNTSLAAAHQIV